MTKLATHIIDRNDVESGHEPFVSVLTPVYNGEEFLRECIESVLEQHYSNWEYVLVNNKSTDNSLQIMEEYAAKDKRIRIHDNEHFLPQMENSNHAFRQISSESTYCKVLHADDLLFPECLNQMVGLAERHETVGIVSSYQINGQNVKTKGVGVTYPSCFVLGKEFGKRYLRNEIKCIALPSAILIRSDLIRKRRQMYDETNLQSDAAAFLDILSESDFGFVHQILIFTRLHGNSVTSRLETSYTHMLGLLRIYQAYAPRFLPKEEAKKVIEKRERIFYIHCARSLIFDNTRAVYARLAKEFEVSGYRMKFRKLFLYLFREILVQPIKKIAEMGNKKLNTGDVHT